MSNFQPVLHILVIEAPNFRKVFSLEANNYSIGRSPNNSIVIPAPSVSRNHATLVYKKLPMNEQDSFWILDGDLQGNKSRYGVFINGKKSLSHQLKHGDTIALGTDVKAVYQQVQPQSSTPSPDLINNNAAAEKLGKSTITSTSIKAERKTLIVEKPELEDLNNPELVRLASFPELSPNPIIEIDLNGNITYINSAALLKFKHINETKLRHPILAGLIALCQNNSGSLSIREIKVEERIFEQYIHFLSESKLIRSYIFDITERKHSEEKLHYQAYYDLLTGLPNRIQFNEQLSLALTSAKQNKTQMAVMFVDLDRFKNINDTLGHAIGDRVLQEFAQRLKSSLGSSALLARWGGDEFTALLPQINSTNEVADICQKVLNSLKPAFELEKQKLYIKSSIGIAIYPQDGDDGETLLKNADAALYRAKEQGRNNYRFYSPIINVRASNLLRLENMLHQALEREEFLVYYQPQINISTGEIYGIEALVRWKHPEFGLIAPDKFIPVAEETDLIIPIGEWVLQTACAQQKALQLIGLPPLRLSVNLSARQFQQPNLVSTIRRALEESGLEPKYLELEITETSIMQNVDFAREVLRNLVKMGVKISMDDFGTGYSSLSYLKKFPFHTLKIDHSFIKDLKDDPQSTAIVSALIALAHALNLRVVAEGVETQQQLELLRNLKCEEVQGFLFSKPLTAQELKQFLLVEMEPIFKK